MTQATPENAPSQLVTTLIQCAKEIQGLAQQGHQVTQAETVYAADMMWGLVCLLFIARGPES